MEWNVCRMHCGNHECFVYWTGYNTLYPIVVFAEINVLK